MTEVAALGLRVTSDGVVKATTDLRGLADAAVGAEKAAIGLSGGAKRADADVRKQGASAAAAASKNKVLDAFSRSSGNSLLQMADSANRSSGALQRFAAMAGGAAGRLVALATAAVSVGGYVRLADAWSDMQSRIGAAVKDMEAAPALMERMVSLANASYSPLNQTVEVYSRNVGVMRDLGYTAMQTADYTEALNHALVTTATRGERAASVQDALAKAMAVGRLQADGLETVMANGGRVAEALASKLGTTTNGLRAMASDGRITSEVIAGALMGSLEDLRREAGLMPATVADGFTRIQTGMGYLIGQFDQATGASSALASMLLSVGDSLTAVGAWIAQNGDTITSAINMAQAAVIGLSTAYAVSLIPTIYAATAGLAAQAGAFVLLNGGIWGTVAALVATKGALMATGFGAIAVAVGTLAYYFLQLSDAVGGFGKAWQMIKDVASEAIDRLIAKFAQISANAKAIWADLKADAVAAFAGIISSGIEFANRYIGIYRGAMSAISVIWGALPSVLGAAAVGAANAAISAIESMLKKAAAAIDSLTGKLASSWIGQQAGMVGTALADAIDLGEIENTYSDEMAGLGAKMSGAFMEGFNTNTINDPKDYFSGVEQGLRDQASAYREAGKILGQEAGRPIESWERLTGVLGKTGEATAALAGELAGGAGVSGGGLAGGAGKAKRGTDELAKSAQKWRDRLRETLTPLEKYNLELAELNKLQGILSKGEMAKAVALLRDELADSLPLVGDLSNAWGDFIAGGMRDFKGFVKSILGSFQSMIAEMIAKAARSKIVMNMSVAGGGVVGGTGAAMAGTGQAGGAGGILGQVLGFGSSVFAGASGLFTSLFGAGGGLSAAGSYLSSVIGSATSSIAAFGAAVGSIAPIALGVVAIGKALFGRKLKDTGLQGTFDASGFKGETYKFYKGGLLRSNKTKTFALDNEVEAQIGGAFTAMRRSIKDMGAALGLGADAIKGFTHDFKFSTKDMSESEILAKLEEEMGAAGAGMAKLILGTGKFTRSGETALDALTRMSGSLTAVNTAMSTLGLGLYRVSAAGGNAASKFVDLFGGLDAFAQSADYYYQNFYSTQERYLVSQKGIAKVLEGIGVKTIPKTERAFRALVERLDKAGRSKGVAELMKIAPAFVEMLQLGAEAASQGTGKGLSDAARSERAGLQKQLLTLQGKTGALRRLELDALDPANRALQKRIWALEKEQAISKEREGLQKQLLTLQGKTGELRRLELDALSPANRALQKRIWALEEEQAISKEREGLQKQLLTALGDTVALRKLETDALYGANRSLQRWLFRLEDAKTVADAATEAFKAAADAERSRIDDLRSMSEGIRDTARQAMQTVFGLTEVQRQSAERQLRTAIQTGRVWDESLSGLAEKAMDVQSQYFGSRVDYLRATGRAAATLAGLANAQDAAANTAEARLEAALKKYGLQDETVLGLTASMDRLDSALGNLARVQAAAAAAFGVTVPAFASGGDHLGGLRIVGENGPELEATGPSRIYNQAQMREILSGREAGANDAVLQAILSQISAMREELVSLNIDTAENTRKIKDMTRKWDNVGTPVRVLT